LLVSDWRGWNLTDRFFITAIRFSYLCCLARHTLFFKYIWVVGLVRMSKCPAFRSKSMRQEMTCATGCYRALCWSTYRWFAVLIMSIVRYLTGCVLSSVSRKYSVVLKNGRKGITHILNISTFLNQFRPNVGSNYLHIFRRNSYTNQNYYLSECIIYKLHPFQQIN
jgi:hypothetical protein